MAPPRATLPRERDSGPRRPALTSVKRVSLLREHVTLRQEQEPQPSYVNVASIKVENETDSSTSLTRSQVTQPSTSAEGSSGVWQQVAKERDSSPRRPALTSAERVRLHRERVRLKQAQEIQPISAIKVEIEISPTPSTTGSLTTQPSTSAADSSDVRQQAVREKYSGPRRPALTSAERVRLHRERVRLRRAQELQPAEITVESEISSLTSITRSLTTQPSMSAESSSGVWQQVANEGGSGRKRGRPALTVADRMRLLSERARLSQAQEPQPSDITGAEIKVEYDTSASTSTAKSLATQSSMSADGSSGVWQQVAREGGSCRRLGRPALTTADRMRLLSERARLSQAQEPEPSDITGAEIKIEYDTSASTSTAKSLATESSMSPEGLSGVWQQVAREGGSGRKRGRPALTVAERMRLLSERARLCLAQEPQSSEITGTKIKVEYDTSALTSTKRSLTTQQPTSAAVSSSVLQQGAKERHTGPRRPGLTSAERVRLHRERVRLKQAQELLQSSETSSSITIATRAPDYRKCWNLATARFKTVFIKNEFGHKCDVCDRLWFKKDLKIAVSRILEEAFPEENTAYFKLCRNCLDACKHQRIPAMSRTNGYEYPPYPTHLPKLGPIEERLISPRLPYMQIRRLRHAGQYGIVEQVINIPVDVNNMVQTLPRKLDDDYAINVNIKESIIHKSSSLSGSVDIEKVKAWLQYLTDKPLYKHYNIRIDWERLEQECGDPLLDPSTFPAKVEEATIEPFDCTQEPESEFRKIRQHTLVWSDVAPGQCVIPLDIIYERHAEELSFPTIYLGEARQIAEGKRDTPFTMCMSELRRSDRRGVTPQHVLYMAIGLLRWRVTDGINNTFRLSTETNNITRKQIEDHDFVEQLVEVNTEFLKTIPNSVQYWASCKRDIFAMFRQLGKPTAFMTLTANEAHWPHLLRILHKWNPEWHAQFGSDITENDIMEKMSPYNRHYLVAEDPVICCVYFYKLISCLLTILSSERTYNPFGRYRVLDFYLRIDFQHCGSPQAHILLWLANDPKEPLSENMPLTVKMLTDLCSVDEQDLSDDALLCNQTHAHTFICYKRGEEQCRFGIPFWPMPETRILLPLEEEGTCSELYKWRVRDAREKLETKSYDSFDAYLTDIGTHSYDDYLQLIRSTLLRPTVFFKRDMSQIYINTFNPWIAARLQSNMDLQLILDPYSCAEYVVHYVNKSKRGTSHFHRQLIELYKQNPQADYTGLMETLALRIINSVEMCAQEAAWFLLRQPMSWASRAIVAIPTIMPHERHLPSNDNCPNNFIEKYEKRPLSLETVTLAQFVAWYDMRPSTHGTRVGGDDEQVTDGEDRGLDADADDGNEAADKRGNTKQSVDPARRRKISRVIKYRTYDAATEMDQYKREQVLLHLPFRNEHADIIDRKKYLQTYAERENEIMEAKRELEADFDTTQLLALITELSDTNDEEVTADAAANDAPTGDVDPLQ